MSQTRWYIDDERMGEASVEVLITLSADYYYYIVYAALLWNMSEKLKSTVIHLIGDNR